MKEVVIGNILKNMRNTNTKLSQKQVGEKLSVYDTTISSYERGNSQPDFQTIVNYADICNFDIRLYNRATNEEVSIEEFSREL